MKKYIYVVICIFVSIMASCRSEEIDEGEGYIQLSSVDIDKSVQSRVGERSQTGMIGIDIINKSDESTYKSYTDWTTLQGKTLELPVNLYTIKAHTTGSSLAEGFDAVPYYEGANDVFIEKDKVQTVNVTCKLAQSMVTVSYSDNFKKYFTNYSSKVTGATGSTTNVTFTSTETRSAYVKANQALNIAVTMIPLIGDNKVSQTLTQTIVEKALPAYRYNVKYDVEPVQGNGSINVSVDQTLHVYEITLGVPLKSDEIVSDEISGDYSKVWGKFAILGGIYLNDPGKNKVQFKYKKSSESTWSIIDAVKDETPANHYSAKVTGLEMGTAYDYKIVCGEEEGNVASFTTEAYQEVPNLNFDTWTQSGKNWFANAVANDYDGEGAYWATGNEGVTSFLAGSHDPITAPVEGNEAYRGKAAKMTSLTEITLVGAAAGNLFIGKYKTNMINPSASVTFGRPYTGARPTKLSGYYKYTSCPTNSGSRPADLTMDECNIYLRLWDASGKEIGFGEFVGKETVEAYTPFEFDIVYSDSSARPATITIVATSSHYGGDFDGAKVVGKVGAGSTLWVDEFELSYD